MYIYIYIYIYITTKCDFIALPQVNEIALTVNEFQ